MIMIRCQEEMSQQVEAIQPVDDSRLVIQKFKVEKGNDEDDDDLFIQTGNVPPGDFPFEELPGSTPVITGNHYYHH